MWCSVGTFANTLTVPAPAAYRAGMGEPDDKPPPDDFHLFKPWRWDRTQQFGLAIAVMLAGLLAWLALFRLSFFLYPDEL